MGGGGGSPLGTASGIALSGAQIFNGLDGNGLDAVQNEYRSLDLCLSHPSPFGQYHYHSWSNCIHNGSKTTIPGKCIDNSGCVDNALEWGRMDGWADTYGNFGGIVGVAKDGHPIYGPYNENGEVWTCDDHDICNGRFFENGSYGYVSTMTHPYVLGCWGPAPMK
jgi:hypothetical protein